MSTFAVFSAVVFMMLLGVALAVVLSVGNTRFYVYEDPRIDVVEGMLPNTNCGACGTPGCRAFAEMAVAGKIAPAKCTVNSVEQAEAIAEYLSVDVGESAKRVARLACAGGSNVAWSRARYEGMGTCRGAALIAGGGKGCSWGCLGLGDCEVVCEFGAITMDEHGLPVVDEPKCTACNDCVEVCPKDLFSLQSVENRLWVACKSLAEGDDALADCAVACTGCGKCAADAPDGLIAMVDHLAVVDYSRGLTLSKTPIERCPTGAIVWLDEESGPQHGAEAKKVLRKSALPVQGT